jgi:hypothetical protein
MIVYDRAGTSNRVRPFVVVGLSKASLKNPFRPRGALLRAYDKKRTGSWSGVEAGASKRIADDVYMVDGKPYIAVAVSGGA